MHTHEPLQLAKTSYDCELQVVSSWSFSALAKNAFARCTAAMIDVKRQMSAKTFTTPWAAVDNRNCKSAHNISWSQHCCSALMQIFLLIASLLHTKLFAMLRCARVAIWLWLLLHRIVQCFFCFAASKPDGRWPWTRPYIHIQLERHLRAAAVLTRLKATHRFDAMSIGGRAGDSRFYYTLNERPRDLCVQEVFDVFLESLHNADAMHGEFSLLETCWLSLEELRPYRKRCMIYLTQFLAACLFFFSCAAARLRPEVKRALFAVCLYEKLTAHGERQHELFCILFLDIFLLFFNLLFFSFTSPSSSRHRTDPTLH